MKESELSELKKALASARPVGTGTIICKGRAYRIDYNYNPPKIKEIEL